MVWTWFSARRLNHGEFHWFSRHSCELELGSEQRQVLSLGLRSQRVGEGDHQYVVKVGHFTGLLLVPFLLSTHCLRRRAIGHTVSVAFSSGTSRTLQFCMRVRGLEASSGRHCFSILLWYNIVFGRTHLTVHLPTGSGIDIKQLSPPSRRPTQVCDYSRPGISSREGPRS